MKIIGDTDFILPQYEAILVRPPLQEPPIMPSNLNSGLGIPAEWRFEDEVVHVYRRDVNPPEVGIRRNGDASDDEVQDVEGDVPDDVPDDVDGDIPSDGVFNIGQGLNAFQSGQDHEEEEFEYEYDDDSYSDSGQLIEGVIEGNATFDTPVFGTPFFDTPLFDPLIFAPVARRQMVVPLLDDIGFD